MTLKELEKVNTMKLTYPAYLYKNADGTYTIEVPDLPGCISYGDTVADAIIMGTDAASGWVLDELEDGIQIPNATNAENVKEKANAIITILVLDMESYAEKYGDKAVRKNLTIPAWLNTFAEKNNVNFSEVLQKNLQQMYLETIREANKKRT